MPYSSCQKASYALHSSPLEATLYRVVNLSCIEPLQLLENLLPLPDLEARVRVAVDLITQNHKGISCEALTFAAMSFYHKLKAADKYLPECKYHGTVTLLKAKTCNELGEGLGGDYRLSEVSRIHRRNSRFSFLEISGLDAPGQGQRLGCSPKCS